MFSVISAIDNFYMRPHKLYWRKNLTPTNQKEKKKKEFILTCEEWIDRVVIY